MRLKPSEPPIDMNDSIENPFERAGAFQKIWMDTFAQMAQAGFSLSPDSAPPELLRQMRSGIFGALSKSWEEFMRSPQFLDSMKTMMDNAIAFRKMSNDFLTEAHHNMQGTARVDIDNLMLAIHHLETRILDRIEEISTRLEQVEARLDKSGSNGASRKRASKAAASKRKPATRGTSAARKQAQSS
ncbi:MAG: hypothetical protein JWR26_314 [Pedosphaera sp.]|nr:hypothetical protein [Pedosphaera sp.]